MNKIKSTKKNIFCNESSKKVYTFAIPNRGRLFVGCDAENFYRESVLALFFAYLKVSQFEDSKKKNESNVRELRELDLFLFLQGTGNTTDGGK